VAGGGLWVSNSSPSGSDWKLDEVVAVGDPPYPAEIGAHPLRVAVEAGEYRPTPRRSWTAAASGERRKMTRKTTEG
jgi:hypothetical protein